MDVKIGDRVRSVKGTCILAVGRTFEIVKSDDEEVYVNTGDEFGVLGYPRDYFEPVAVADSNGNVEHGNRFKVGDRVRVIRRGDEDGGSFHSAKIGEEFTVTKIYDEPEAEIHTNVWYFYPHEIEPVDAPLTIHEGGYYRTRDGRKVGPMKWDADGHFATDGWHYDASGECSYMGNGRDLPDEDYCLKHDIIAEWADEPAGSTTGFTVPLEAPEFGGAESKFKVGDRVAYADGKTNGLGEIIEVLNGSEYDYIVRVESKDARYAYYPDGVGRKFTGKDLRLVAEATSGKDDKTTLKFDVDLSEAEETIDRLINKLQRANELRDRLLAAA